MSSYQYRDSHYKDKTVSQLSYLHNRNPHTWKDHLYIEIRSRSVDKQPATWICWLISSGGFHSGKTTQVPCSMTFKIHNVPIGKKQDNRQIPQCPSPISHNAPFCNRYVQMCIYFCYKMVHCGILKKSIVWFMRSVNRPSIRLSSMGQYFDYLLNLSVEKWQKTQIYCHVASEWILHWKS